LSKITKKEIPVLERFLDVDVKHLISEVMFAGKVLRNRETTLQNIESVKEKLDSLSMYLMGSPLK
jgi:hypothetical protein